MKYSTYEDVHYYIDYIIIGYEKQISDCTVVSKRMVPKSLKRVAALQQRDQLRDQYNDMVIYFQFKNSFHNDKLYKHHSGPIHTPKVLTRYYTVTRNEIEVQVCGPYVSAPDKAPVRISQNNKTRPRKMTIVNVGDLSPKIYNWNTHNVIQNN